MHFSVNRLWTPERKLPSISLPSEAWASEGFIPGGDGEGVTVKQWGCRWVGAHPSAAGGFYWDFGGGFHRDFNFCGFFFVGDFVGDFVGVYL